MYVPQRAFLAQTFTGRVPFVMNYQSGLYEIMAGRRPDRPDTLTHDELWKLIQKCWNQDPGNRPNASEIVEIFKRS